MNVILIVCDTLRADHLGCYGTERASAWFTAHGGEPIRTPCLDRLASEGTLFERAHPDSLPTIQVRRALHTGRRSYPFHNWRPVRGDIVYLPGWQPIPQEQQTVAETLGLAGYRTGFITDCLPYFAPGFNFTRGFHTWQYVRGQQQDKYAPLSRARAFAGPDGDPVARYVTGPHHRERVERTLRQYLANVADRRSEEDWFAPSVYRQAMRWLEENVDAAREGKVFLHVDQWDPHEPWDPPVHYVKRFDPAYEVGRDGADVIHPLYAPADWLSGAELRHMRANYAGEVAMVDRWLGQFLNRVDDLGLRENTLLVFVVDHGYLLGEHGMVGKMGEQMYPEIVDLPLLIRYPGAPPGRRSAELVYNLDVVPTILAAAGVAPASPLDGQDLTPLLTDEGVWRRREYVTSAFNRSAWVRTDDYTLNVGFDGSAPRLVDVRADPGHDRNVAAERPDVVRELFHLCLYDAGGDLPLYDRPTTFADGSTVPRK